MSREMMPPRVRGACAQAMTHAHTLIVLFLLAFIIAIGLEASPWARNNQTQQLVSRTIRKTREQEGITEMSLPLHYTAIVL